VDWVRYRLAKALTDTEEKSIRSLAGPRYLPWRNEIVAPENAAWLTENALRTLGRRFSVTARAPSPPPLSPATPKPDELRDWVPAFLVPYQRDLIVQHGNRDGVLALMPPGCLAGDTLIPINRAGKGFKIRLDMLVTMFNGGSRQAGRGKTRWDLSIPTMAQSNVDGFVRLNQIIGAVESGMKSLFLLRAENGASLRLTADHVLLTSVGERTLAALRAGDAVLTAVWPTTTGVEKKPRYVEVVGMANHPHARYDARVRRAGQPHGRGKVFAHDWTEHRYRVPQHRVVVEAEMNGLTYEAFVARVRAGDTSGLTFLDPALHVHHRDRNPKNNVRGNLVVLTEEEHLRLHGEDDGWKHVNGRFVPTRVTSIEPVGEEMTYDLQMKMPHNNFVANGFSVHNSGKTVCCIIYGLLRPGPILYATRAGARRQVRREIERFTTASTFLVEGLLREPPPKDARFIIVGWESLQYNIDFLLAANPVTFIADECFPAGTMVTTEAGPTPIEQVEPGVRALTVGVDGLEWRTVTARGSFPLRRALVRVVHEYGSFTCTEDHRVSADGKEIAAASLQRGARLRTVRETVQDVEVPARSERTFLLSSLLSSEPRNDNRGENESYQSAQDQRNNRVRAVERRATHGGGSADARVERDFGGGSGSRTKSRSAAGPSVPNTTWRERFDCAYPTAASRAASGFGAGVHRRDAGVVADGSGLQLQGGHSLPGVEGGDRSGRLFASDEAGASAGRAEGFDLVESRVVRVEIYEQASPRVDGLGGGADPCVYDLEVEGAHRYFADGVLVHNCHLIKSGKRREAVLNAVNGKIKFRELKNRAMAAEKLSRRVRYRIGATGTFVPNRLRDAWAQLDLIVPDGFGRGGYPFFRRYCAAHQNAYGGLDTRGTSPLPFIDELLRRMSYFTYYVPQAVSHRDLPPKRRQVVYIPQDELGTGREVVKELKEHPFRSGSDTWALLALAGAMKRGRVVEEALAVAVPSLEGGGGKVTVFTGLRSECERIAAAMRKANPELTVWVAHGGHSQQEREAIQDEYMAHPGPCALVATGDSFGASLNLNKTDVAIMAMLPWTLGEVEQREQRFWRMDQTRPVLILYLVAEGTYDERVAQTLLEKLPAVEEVGKSELAVSFGADLRGDEDEIAKAMVAKMMKMEDV
jgi:hypothetical protein